jgi:hypothetical protein
MDTNGTNGNVAWLPQNPIPELVIRTVQLNVEMSPQDFRLLKKAAEKKMRG